MTLTDALKAARLSILRAAASVCAHPISCADPACVAAGHDHEGGEDDWGCGNDCSCVPACKGFEPHVCPQAKRIRDLVAHIDSVLGAPVSSAEGPRPECGACGGTGRGVTFRVDCAKCGGSGREPPAPDAQPVQCSRDCDHPRPCPIHDAAQREADHVHVRAPDAQEGPARHVCTDWCGGEPGDSDDCDGCHGEVEHSTLAWDDGHVFCVACLPGTGRAPGAGGAT